MIDYPNILEDVEIARAGTHDNRTMLREVLEDAFDGWLTSDDEIPIQRGHDGAQVGEITDLDLRAGSLYATLVFDDDAWSDIVAGKLAGLSVDVTGGELHHLAVLDPDHGEQPGMRALPVLQHYLDDPDDTPEEETNMSAHVDFGDFKAARLCTYVTRVAQWQRHDRSPDQRRDAPPLVQTPQQAGEGLTRLVHDYQASHPGTPISGDEAMEVVRGTAEGARLYAIWSGGGRSIVRSFGTQSRSEEGAVRAKERASREIDARARRFAAGAGVSYSLAVGHVLAADPQLRKQYEEC